MTRCLWSANAKCLTSKTGLEIPCEKSLRVERQRWAKWQIHMFHEAPEADAVGENVMRAKCFSLLWHQHLIPEQ